MTLRFPLWLYRLLRPAPAPGHQPLRTASAGPGPRYGPATAAAELDLMALLAETISGYEVREPRAQAWARLPICCEPSPRRNDSPS